MSLQNNSNEWVGGWKIFAAASLEGRGIGLKLSVKAWVELVPSRDESLTPGKWGF